MKESIKRLFLRLDTLRNDMWPISNVFIMVLVLNVTTFEEAENFKIFSIHLVVSFLYSIRPIALHLMVRREMLVDEILLHEVRIVFSVICRCQGTWNQDFEFTESTVVSTPTWQSCNDVVAFEGLPSSLTRSYEPFSASSSFSICNIILNDLAAYFGKFLYFRLQLNNCVFVAFVMSHSRPSMGSDQLIATVSVVPVQVFAIMGSLLPSTYVVVHFDCEFWPIAIIQ